MNHNIIIFSGWGANITKDAIANQVEYANIFRPELKTATHISHIRSLANSTDLVFRETGVGEEDLAERFLKNFRIYDAQFDTPEYTSTIEAAEKAHQDAAHLGTLNFFPIINQNIHRDQQRRRIYDIFFDTWIEYSMTRYTGVYTYDPVAAPLNPLRPASTSTGSRVLAATLSPYVFERFLALHLSPKQLQKLFSTPLERLIILRNGDWRHFADAYHQLAEAISQEISTFDERKMILDLDQRSYLWDEKISKALQKETGVDTDSIISFVATIIGSASSVPGLAYLAKGISLRARRSIKRVLERYAIKIQRDPLSPFLFKLRQVLS